MIDKQLINQLTEQYVISQDDGTFQRLIECLTPLINVQLGKNYSSMQLFWDDMRQDVFVKILERKQSIQDSQTEQPYQFWYLRIRDWLNRIVKTYSKYHHTSSINDLTEEDLFRANKIV